jgi:N-acetylated-alpha-linked acidic dipeptidase
LFSGLPQSNAVISDILNALRCDSFLRMLFPHPISIAGVLYALIGAAAPAMGQTGFTAAGAERQREIESRALAAIDPERFEELSATLSAAPHVAGSPGQAAFRDTLLARLTAWGYEPEIASYRVYLPWATDVTLSIVAPDSVALDAVEGPVEGATEPDGPRYPLANGYTGVGDVEAEAVYVNYGLHEDYAGLAAAGIDVRGKVAVARYGRSYRGIKARLAEDHGALALVLYSDPIDDGWFRGEPFPEGPWRPRTGVQRGSVKNGEGDPTTPDGPSVDGAVRVAPEDSPHDLLAIPVIPVSADIAAAILSRIGNARIPQSDWQGALPFRYHVGPGPAAVRLRVGDDRTGPDAGFKQVHDVSARIAGSEWPDELVIVGAHIDAWGPGANDNVSGTTSVLSAARAVRELAEAGFPPRRTIVFAGWDGEEWGLVGSTEWVEQNAGVLAESAVAYLNQDMIAGPGFGASASPSLKPLVREAAGAIPATAGTLRAQWARADSTLGVGDLGGGSDHEGFYQHLGIPSAGHGFGGPYGLYHSAYDTREAVEIADPGYRNQTLSAELVAVMALRLANAETLPLDYAAFARELADLWRERRAQVVAATASEVAIERLDAALDSLAAAAARFETARDGYLAGRVDPERSRAANDELRAVERELTRESGLVGRPWNRNLVFSTDDRNGYATLALPGIAEALLATDTRRVGIEVDDLATRVEAAAARLAAAGRALAP